VLDKLRVIDGLSSNVREIVERALSWRPAPTVQHWQACK